MPKEEHIDIALGYLTRGREARQTREREASTQRVIADALRGAEEAIESERRRREAFARTVQNLNVAAAAYEREHALRGAMAAIEPYERTATEVEARQESENARMRQIVDQALARQRQASRPPIGMAPAWTRQPPQKGQYLDVFGNPIPDSDVDDI